MVDYETDVIRFVAHDLKLLDQVNLKGDYFRNQLNGRFYDFLKEHKQIDYIAMLKSFSSEESELFVDLVYSCDYAESGKFFVMSYAETIIEDYKKRQTNNLIDMFKNNVIDYSKYYHELMKLNNISVVSQVNKLTEEQINEIISEENKYIKINRFEYLSVSLKLNLTDVVTVAGISGFGKSAFLLNIYQSLSQDMSNNFKCHYFNLEVSPKAMIKRLLAITSNHNISDFIKENINSDFVREAKRKVINDSYIESGSTTLEIVKEKILNNIDKNKTNVIFIDHIGLLDTENKYYSKTEYDRVTYCMKELRNLALDHNLIIFIASQFDRNSVKDKKISMHSLKSSGEIENSSTHVLLLKESESRVSKDQKTYEEISIDVAKNRNGPIDKLDYYTFIKPKQIFNESNRNY